MTLFFWLLTTVSLGLAQATEVTEYTIGSGDTVNIVVHGHDFERNDYTVSASGHISFPYVGQVKLSGLTPFQTEEAIETALRDGYLVDPEVTVNVQNFGATVHVIGEVDKEGAQTLTGSTTVREALSNAGMGSAAGANIKLTRSDGTIVRFDFAELEGEAGSMRLQQGDVLEVASGFSVFLAGEVENPGAIRFTDGITVSQALIRAGGNTEFARLSGAYVVRDGQRTRVNLKRVLKGKDADFVLQPGDRVVVPISAL